MKHFAPVLILAIGVAGLSAGAVRAEDIYQDLRGQDFDKQRFRLHGPDAALYTKSEPQGLRVTLPAHVKNDPVGLHTKFPVQGDFEITLGYEILQAERSPKGDGA